MWVLVSKVASPLHYGVRRPGYWDSSVAEKEKRPRPSAIRSRVFVAKHYQGKRSIKETSVLSKKYGFLHATILSCREILSRKHRILAPAPDDQAHYDRAVHSNPKMCSSSP